MKLKDIENEINSRYVEIYNRIEKYFDKLKYAKNKYDDCSLYCWYFNYHEGIEVLMVRDNYNSDKETIHIDPKFLENDEVFEKWVNEISLLRKEKDEELELKWKTLRDQEDFRKYQELKNKFEK